MDYKNCHYYCLFNGSKHNHGPQACNCKIQEKYVAMPSQQLRIHQYKICLMHNPGPGLYITDFLSTQNYTENKEGEMVGINKSINSINITTYISTGMATKDIQAVIQDDKHLQDLKSIAKRLSVEKEWCKKSHTVILDIKNELAMTHAVTMKGKWSIMPAIFAHKAVEQLHCNDMA